MDAYKWFSFILAVASLVSSVLTVIIYRGFQSGRWVQSRIDDIERMGNRVANLEGRMDRAGKQMSDIATDLQGLPEELRGIFLSRESFAQFAQQNADERAQLRREVERLWEAMRGSRTSRS